MIHRTTRLRWRRRLRTSKKQVEDIGFQAEEHLDKHLFRRITKLPGVLRFTSTWIALMLILISGVVVQARSLSNYYLTKKPVPGGIYTEGILGTFTNANPLFATSPVDTSVSNLIFSGLLRLDSKNVLIGDLASSWQADESELNYTVRLKKDLKWQDGQPLTAEDVVFTYQTIQNPDARSPMFSGWQGITVTAKDRQTVVFTLPNTLSSFPYALTNGIVPKHLLKDVPTEQLRSINFNSAEAVGSGPFKLSAINVTGGTPEDREEQIALVPFEDYANGKPKLNKFNIRAFHKKESLQASFKNNELSGAVGLDDSADLSKDGAIIEYHIPLLGEVVVFFKTSEAPFNDVKVRKALVLGTNTTDIVTKLGFPAVVANAPLLKSQLGYNKALAQYGYDQNAAKKLLDEAGWVQTGTDTRTKGGSKLKIALYAQDETEYARVAQKLQKQWREIGVETELNLQSTSDLQSKQLPTHSYGALLYGIEIGPDPDVFAYWHSSQADITSQNHLNYSEYKSETADTALAAGRTRANPDLRNIRYQSFLNTWRNDAPAIALYQPRFYYVTRGKVFNFNPTSFTNGVSRYANVYNWMIREDKLQKD